MSGTQREALPSLNALRTFEATVRCRSMTKAAEELCVTHGAVSRQIKALEAAIGLKLLTRFSRHVEPTPEGVRLAEGLATAFGMVASAVERVQPGSLTLSCSSSITMCWLLPRVSGFYKKNPGIELTLDLNYDRVTFVRFNITVAIRISTIEPPPEAVIHQLGAEWIGPVCAPEYADRAPDWSGMTLLSTKTRPGAWTDWLAACGKQPATMSASRQFNHFYLVVQAAACGLGVAVVPRMLALEELQSGRLVAPLGFVPGSRRLSLWIASRSSARQDVKALEQWLLEEMGNL